VRPAEAETRIVAPGLAITAFGAPSEVTVPDPPGAMETEFRMVPPPRSRGVEKLQVPSVTASVGFPLASGFASLLTESQPSGSGGKTVITLGVLVAPKELMLPA